MGLCDKVVFVLMTMAFCRVSMCEVYKVGDTTGWTNISHVDYKAWSATKNFHVGDTILFQYNNQLHNVVRVTHKNFNACNATSSYATFTSGNDSFIIKKTGHFYFICSVPGHCQLDGQKVDIRVTRAPPPIPAPAPSGPLPSPSPSPSLLPSPPSSPQPLPSPPPSPQPLPSPPPSPQPLPSPPSSPSLLPSPPLSPQPLPSPPPSPSPSGPPLSPQPLPSPPSSPSTLPSPPPSPSGGNVPGSRNSAIAIHLTMGLLASKFWLSLVVTFCVSGIAF